MNPRVLNPEHYMDIGSLGELVFEFSLEEEFGKEFGEGTPGNIYEHYDRMLKYINVPGCIYSYFYIYNEYTEEFVFYRFKTEDLREHVMAVTVPVTTKEKK